MIGRRLSPLLPVLLAAVGCVSPPADGIDSSGDDDRPDPAPIEVCNGLDDDGDGLVDEDGPAGEPELFDSDGDGLSPCRGDCDDQDPLVHPGAKELCDGLDSDCDGLAPDGEQDEDEDGSPACADCDDSRPSVHPLAPEVFGNLRDDDCDGWRDEGLCSSRSDAYLLGSLHEAVGAMGGGLAIEDSAGGRTLAALLGQRLRLTTLDSGNPPAALDEVDLDLEALPAFQAAHSGARPWSWLFGLAASREGEFVAFFAASGERSDMAINGDAADLLALVVREGEPAGVVSLRTRLEAEGVLPPGAILQPKVWLLPPGPDTLGVDFLVRSDELVLLGHLLPRDPPAVPELSWSVVDLSEHPALQPFRFVDMEPDCNIDGNGLRDLVVVSLAPGGTPNARFATALVLHDYGESEEIASATAARVTRDFGDGVLLDSLIPPFTQLACVRGSDALTRTADGELLAVAPGGTWFSSSGMAQLWDLTGLPAAPNPVDDDLPVIQPTVVSPIYVDLVEGEPCAPSGSYRLCDPGDLNGDGMDEIVLSDGSGIAVLDVAAVPNYNGVGVGAILPHTILGPPGSFACARSAEARLVSMGVDLEAMGQLALLQ